MIPENLSEAETVVGEEVERLFEVLRNWNGRDSSRCLAAINTLLADLIPAIDNLEQELED